MTFLLDVRHQQKILQNCNGEISKEKPNGIRNSFQVFFRLYMFQVGITLMIKKLENWESS